jgi:uncharacterized membrane protein YfhO
MLFKKINRNLFFLGILILILFDLWRNGLGYYSGKKTDEIFTKSQILETIKRDPEKFRVFDMSGGFNNVLQHNKIESVSGINPIILQDYKEFIWKTGEYDNSVEGFISINEINNLSSLRLLNVKYVASKEKLDVPGLLLSASDPGYYLYKLHSFLPRAYKIPFEKVNRKGNQILFSDKDIPNQKSFLLKAIYNSNQISLIINTPSPSYLVLSEIWYPGWKAYDNGKEIPIYKANNLLRSVLLEKGKHNLVFIFDSYIIKAGTIISVFTICVCLLFIVRRKLSKS